MFLFVVSDRSISPLRPRNYFWLWVVQSSSGKQAQAQHTQQPSMGTAAKAVKTVMPRPAKHWVGNGFNVYPVFAHMAFTKALSPWLMFDYAAPQQVS